MFGIKGEKMENNYYKSSDNEIYSFIGNNESETMDNKIKELGLVSITEEEFNEIQNKKDIDNQVAEKKELSTLEAFLDQSNYIVINLGKKFTEEARNLYFKEVSSRFNMTNLEVMEKQEEAIARINELKEIIKK